MPSCSVRARHSNQCCPLQCLHELHVTCYYIYILKGPGENQHMLIGLPFFFTDVK